MNLFQLQNKKILLLSPAFFNYEKIIKNKMEQMGAIVTFYDERAVTSAQERAILKISPKMFKKKAKRYYQHIIAQHCNDNYDFILIIKGDMVSIETIESLKRTFSCARLCLYIWDSISNIPYILKKIPYFDFASSNDRKDCMAVSELNFRPLFFSDNFRKKQACSHKCQYDLSFCGTIHSDRYKIIKNIDEQCQNMGLIFYKFAYLQSKFIYYFYKFTKKEFRKTKQNYFNFIKKPQVEIAEIENSSKTILDIQHPAQTGLTMRTIEMIGMEKKLITTNADIVNYDFYDSNNIYIIDRINPALIKEFIAKPYRGLPEEIYEKYSLTHWILDVLGVGEAKS